MIEKAYYVKCDLCGWPALFIGVNSAIEARKLATQEEGFIRTKRLD